MANTSKVCFAVFCTFFLLLGPSWAADPEPAAVITKETKEASGIARNEKDIPIPQPKSDKKIADRLTKIFELTGWFEGLKVTSQEGIVTLTGKVGSVGERDWAVDLASDADGVVAVINKVELKEAAWFDLGSTKKELKNLWKSFFTFIPHLLIAGLILVVAIALFRFFSGLNKRFWANRITNPILADVMGKIGALPVLLLGLYLVLQVLGLTGLAFTLLGGTGALGLVAGFAFKNILENYFSGIMLSVRKPFVVGDIIEVAGETGVVFKMTTRGTTLVDLDGKHILIPNSTIFTSIIRNRSAGPLSRVQMTFDVKTENAETQREELLRYLQSRPEIVKKPEIDLHLNGTDDHPELAATFWVDPKKTSIEKLQNVIRAFAKGKTPATGRDKTATATTSEVHDILARAASTHRHDPKETNL